MPNSRIIAFQNRAFVDMLDFALELHQQAAALEERNGYGDTSMAKAYRHIAKSITLSAEHAIENHQLDQSVPRIMDDLKDWIK